MHRERCPSLADTDRSVLRTVLRTVLRRALRRALRTPSQLRHERRASPTAVFVPGSGHGTPAASNYCGNRRCTQASLHLHTPGQLGLPRVGHIKEGLARGVRLRGGQPPPQNRNNDGTNHQKSRRAAGEPRRPPDGPPNVSSTLRPMSPWSGCTSSERVLKFQVGLRAAATNAGVVGLHRRISGDSPVSAALPDIRFSRSRRQSDFQNTFVEPASTAPAGLDKPVPEIVSLTRTEGVRELADWIGESSRLGRRGLRPNPSFPDGHLESSSSRRGLNGLPTATGFLITRDGEGEGKARLNGKGHTLAPLVRGWEKLFCRRLCLHAKRKRKPVGDFRYRQAVSNTSAVVRGGFCQTS